jgi:hypothetical protein
LFVWFKASAWNHGKQGNQFNFFFVALTGYDLVRKAVFAISALPGLKVIFVRVNKVSVTKSTDRIKIKRRLTFYQGCQMVCFLTKIPNSGKFWWALDCKIKKYLFGRLEYLRLFWKYSMTIWYVLCPFGTFFQLWYHVPRNIWQPCFLQNKAFVEAVDSTFKSSKDVFLVLTSKQYLWRHRLFTFP